MRTFSKIAALSAVSMSLSTFPVGAKVNSDELEDCRAYPQEGMRQCLAKKAKASEFALRRAETKTAADIAKWDEDAKYVAQAAEKLRASNAAFAQFREAQCAFAASLGGGAIGNALEIRHLACIADMNTARAAGLAGAVSGLPMK